MTKLNDHKTITVSLLTPPKQTNGKIIRQYLFHLKLSRKRHKSFLFLLRGKTTGFRDTNRGDNSSLCGEGTHRSAVALKDGFSQRLHSQHLGGRKDIKAFSQSWQKNTGKWVDPMVLTKSGAGSASVPCFHAELHCCDGWTAGKVQSTVAQLWLLKVDVNFKHCIIVIFASIVILKLLNACLIFFFKHTHAWGKEGQLSTGFQSTNHPSRWFYWWVPPLGGI